MSDELYQAICDEMDADWENLVDESIAAKLSNEDSPLDAIFDKFGVTSEDFIKEAFARWNP